MNRKLSYGLTALGIVIAIMIGDYIGYQLVVNKMEQMQTDYEGRLSEQVDVEVTTGLEDKAAEIVGRIVEDQRESILASTSEDKLSVDTVYQIQCYDVNTENTSTDYETLPQELVGLTRDEVDDYCNKYMDKLPVEEYLDVVAFSRERLVIKKIFDSSKVAFRYYLIAVDGEVVVYYGDKKTVYEYTGIETKDLSKEDRKMLKQGLEVKDDAALYSILENYSS